MKVYNSSNNTLIADRVKMADNIVTRTFGLIPRKSLEIGEGLIIKPCYSIHTFFMRIAIDVIFIKKSGEIVGLYSNVKPYRILPIHFSSHYVLELPSGEILAKKIKKGDIIQL